MYIKAKTFLSPLLLCLSVTSCLTRAPTQYELDKRGVTTPSNEAAVGADENLRTFSTGSHIARQTRMPERLPPLIEKVWVEPQLLADGSKIEGTWMWITVDQGRWLEDDDAGSAPLTFDENHTLRPSK